MPTSRTRSLIFGALLLVLTVLGGTSLWAGGQAVSPQVLSQVLGVISILDEGPPPEVAAILGTPDTQGFEQAWVEEVIDGDTIRLHDGRTVRYIGIDTPETKHPTKGVQCFGKEASQRNRELVEHQLVSLQKDVSETDRYDRLLRYVWKDGVLINALLVKEGFAHSASFPPDITKQPQLQTAEALAREAGAGLWTACSTETAS